jgi:hypothetical protein
MPNQDRPIGLSTVLYKSLRSSFWQSYATNTHLTRHYFYHNLGELISPIIQTGMMAAIQATRDPGSGALTARIVVIIPGKPMLHHVVGWVTQYSGTSITIKAHDGNSYTFSLSGDTKILPEERAAELTVGSFVTIIAPRDPSSTQRTAQGIVVHPAGSGEGSLPATQSP